MKLTKQQVDATLAKIEGMVGKEHAERLLRESTRVNILIIDFLSATPEFSKFLGSAVAIGLRMAAVEVEDVIDSHFNENEAN